MNSLQKVLQENKKMHSVFFTAGFPKHRSISQQLSIFKQFGVDFVELGIPFSDPVADGPIIQDSSTQALNSGMNLDKIFHELSAFKGDLPLPVVMMGYLNTVLAYGEERFVKAAKAAGVSGVLIPDLPPELFEKMMGELFLEAGICPVFMIDPHTQEKRILEIDAISGAFIYAVTKSATTGNAEFAEKEVIAFLSRLQAMPLKTPVIAGFGISSADRRKSILPYVKGTIIGSALIRAQMEERETAFLKELMEQN